MKKLISFTGGLVSAVVLALFPGASVAQASGSCPSTGSFCFYQDNGFLNFIASSAPGTCNALIILTSPYQQTSSFRNRTSSAVRFYDVNRTASIVVPANTEVSSLGTTYGSYWNDRIAWEQRIC